MVYEKAYHTGYRDLTQLRSCNLDPISHQKRKAIYRDSAESLVISIKDLMGKPNFEKSLDGNSSKYPLLSLLKHNQDFAVRFDPRWKDKKFGVVGTIESSGCLALVSYNLLSLQTTANVSVKDICHNIVSNGFRMWKFSNAPKTVLNLPFISLPRLKHAFTDNAEIQNCHSIEEAMNILGKPVGIGGSMYYLDELISLYSYGTAEPYWDTHIWNVNTIIENLEHGYLTPVRVSNNVYRDDPSNKEGHYVILVGFENGEAVIIDSNAPKGIYRCPTKRFFEAMIENPNLVSAWDTSSIK